MPIVPSIVKATLSYLHGKAAIREGLDLLPSVSVWAFNLQLRKKPMEICLKVQVICLQPALDLLKDLQSF